MEFKRKVVLPALACLAFTAPAAFAADASGPMEVYVGLAGELGSDVDPGDYAGIPSSIQGSRDASGAAGLYAGVRRGRLGLEVGWMFERSVRWRETVTGAVGPDTLHEATVRLGGPYLAAALDVVSFTDAAIFVKGGVARGSCWQWRSVQDDRVVASGRSSSGSVLLAGAGARLALSDSGLELRAEGLWHHDSDVGTSAVFRTGLGWRF